jgi:multidrug efflux pump subunit AcrA (membrane-fusion protein)
MRCAGKIIFVKLVILLMLLMYISGCSIGGSNNSNNDDISLKAIGRGNIESSIAVNGLLESKNTVDVFFPANHKVMNILVKKYQKVEIGDKLAEIIPNVSSAAVDASILAAALLSPISGYVSEVYTKKDAVTTAAQPVFQITDVDDLYIRSTVRQGDLKYLKTGQNVIVKADAFPGIAAMNGILDLIVPFARKSTTVSAEDIIIDIGISFENKSQDLKPGYTVSCDIMTARAENVLLLPLESLMEDKNKGKYVYIYDREQGRIFVKNIVLGVVSDFFAEIKSGIAEGDEVVLNPKPAYKDGMKVKYNRLKTDDN